MRVIAVLFGVVLVLLGGLWMLQGLGLVTIGPILCVADCSPLTGPSILWAILGLLAIVAGGGLVAWARRGGPPPL